MNSDVASWVESRDNWEGIGNNLQSQHDALEQVRAFLQRQVAREQERKLRLDVFERHRDSLVFYLLHLSGHVTHDNFSVCSYGTVVWDR